MTRRLTVACGFTLVELLVTLIVGGILLSVAVPGFSVFLQNANQVSSANELLASLHFARDLATTRNVRVTICPSQSGNDCEPTSWVDGWIVFEDEDSSHTVNNAETVAQVGSGMRVLTAESTEFPSYLVYRPNGRIMVDDVGENTGEFTLCDSRGTEHARVVIVDPSGRPRVSRNRADQSAPVCL